MTKSSNSTNCVMSNSSYSSDSVMDKSEDKVFLFFISKYSMTKSSNSTNCVMSNSGYSSDGMVNKSKDEVSVVVIYFKSIFYKFIHNFVCHFINFFISKYGMTKSSNSTDCVMSNSG